MCLRYRCILEIQRQSLLRKAKPYHLFPNSAPLALTFSPIPTYLSSTMNSVLEKHSGDVRKMCTMLRHRNAEVPANELVMS